MGIFFFGKKFSWDWEVVETFVFLPPFPLVSALIISTPLLSLLLGRKREKKIARWEKEEKLGLKSFRALAAERKEF
jgi:hypothetical protein